MYKSLLICILFIILIFGVIFYFFDELPRSNTNLSNFVIQDEKEKLKTELHPLSIEALRNGKYPGSDIVIEQTLDPGSNYQRYLVSYRSEGLKIYALLTIPNGISPQGGWPVIIFNHGYIPPAEYRTTERYVAYTDAFSRNGYILLRPDYRGHGNSEGNPEGAYYSPAYTVDVLNAVASIKRDATDAALRQAQGLSSQIIHKEKIGMWGHSMGGSITLRSMVTTKDVKAGVIWAGVVASYEDILKNWVRSRPWIPSQREQAFRRPGRQMLIDKYGEVDKNPAFWQSIAPIYSVKDISGPVQIHHGTFDDDVPVLFSEKLNQALKDANKEVEFYTYQEDDHNLSQNLNAALQRSVDFFDKYLK